MMAKLKTRLRALGRFGLLLALLTLGVALVISAWANRREAEQISALLDRGQSERFFRAIPELHQRNRGAATSSDLANVLAQFREEGLRYLVEYDTAGKLVAEAGEHVGTERPRPSSASSQPSRVGDRIRVTFHPPPRVAGPEGGRGPQPPRDEPRRGPGDARPPPPDGAGPPREAHLPDLVIEFEPTVANQLRDRAAKNFVFSTTAALSLLALTIALGLALLREERRRERTERERHLAVLGEMSAVMAHEIRNPLASLKGTAQLLGEQLDAESPLQKKVGRIVSEAKRLEELTDTLLDLVRSSSVERLPTDPAQLLRDAAEAVDAGRITIDATNAPTSWSLDALRMEQVLKNLLQNALQAAPAGSPIETSVGLEAGKLVMRVRDHGAGLPNGAADALFEAFHTTRVKGTGLGLAVARRIVELHGGQIRAENHVDGGALFTLWIPT